MGIFTSGYPLWFFACWSKSPHSRFVAVFDAGSGRWEPHGHFHIVNAVLLRSLPYPDPESSGTNLL